LLHSECDGLPGRIKDIDAVEAAKAVIKDDLYPRVTIAHLDLIDPDNFSRIAVFI
jgi:hypothetical protein